jgi:diamine N-acetyltransferase
MSLEIMVEIATNLFYNTVRQGCVTKALEHEGQLVGFTMYRYDEEHQAYVLSRLMIDRKYHGNGLGTKALTLILNEMRNSKGNTEVFLSTEPDNIVAKHIYAKIGFVPQNEKWDDEDVYKIVLS